MRYTITAIMILVLSSGCATVSDVGSSAWRRTKSLFGAGEEETAIQKTTVETYPSRTVISTLEQPEMRVETKPEKVQVQPRGTLETAPSQIAGQQDETRSGAETPRAKRRQPGPVMGPTQGPVPLKGAQVDREERSVQEKIDRTVEELRKKHQRQRIWGIF